MALEHNDGLYTEVTIKRFIHDEHGWTQSEDITTYLVEDEEDFILEAVIQKFAIIDGMRKAGADG